MKLVMVGPYPEPGRQVSGGVERVIDTLLPELADAVDLTLVVPGASHDAETHHHGVRTIYLQRGGGPGALAYWTIDARRLARVVTAMSPDLVHLQGVGGVGRLVSAPRILTIHGIVHRDLLTSTRGQRWNWVARHGIAQVLRMVEARARRQVGNVIVINPYVIEALPDVARLRQFPIPDRSTRHSAGTPAASDLVRDGLSPSAGSDRSRTPFKPWPLRLKSCREMNLPPTPPLAHSTRRTTSIDAKRALAMTV